MFTIEEYFQLKEKIRNLDLELFKVKTAFKYTYQYLSDKDKDRVDRLINICEISEETKTQIYDSRTTEDRKTEAELNTEAVS